MVARRQHQHMAISGNKRVSSAGIGGKYQHQASGVTRHLDVRSMAKMKYLGARSIGMKKRRKHGEKRRNREEGGGSSSA